MRADRRAAAGATLAAVLAVTGASCPARPGRGDTAHLPTAHLPTACIDTVRTRRRTGGTGWT